MVHIKKKKILKGEKKKTAKMRAGLASRHC